MTQPRYYNGESAHVLFVALDNDILVLRKGNTWAAKVENHTFLSQKYDSREDSKPVEYISKSDSVSHSIKPTSTIPSHQLVCDTESFVKKTNKKRKSFKKRSQKEKNIKAKKGNKKQKWTRENKLDIQMEIDMDSVRECQADYDIDIEMDRENEKMMRSLADDKVPFSIDDLNFDYTNNLFFPREEEYDGMLLRARIIYDDEDRVIFYNGEYHIDYHDYVDDSHHDSDEDDEYW